MNTMRLVRVACIFFFLLVSSGVHGVTVSSGELDRRVPLREGWKMNLSDDEAFKSPQLDDTSWKQGSLPVDLDKAETGGSQYLWLRNAVIFTGDFTKRKAYLLLNKIPAATAVYLNGVLIAEFGKFPPGQSYMEALPKQAPIPPELIRPDTENTLCIRLYNEKAVFRILRIEAGNYDAFVNDSKLLRFVNMDVYLVFSFLTLVIGGYFLLQYLQRKSERPNLHFSLANFCFAIYFFNMGIEVNPLSFKLGNAISQSFMPLFFPLLVIFFVNYFAIHNNKWLKRGVLGLGIALSLLFYIDAAGVPISLPGLDLFTLALIPGGLELVFMAYVAIRSTIYGNKDALVIMIGTLFGFFLGVHDMVYQFTGMQPFTWLQGPGIFLFDMSMFVSLSNRTMRAFKELEVSAVEIVSKTGELETYINNIAELSNNVSGMSSQLDESIASASASIDKMASTSEAIITDIKDQYDTVQKTSAAVTGLIDALEVTYGDLGKQFSHVQETSATIEEMIANIAAITRNVKHTTEFAEELKNSTAYGEEAVIESAKSIEGIRVVSESVNKIIDTVSDIAEQTNILSINAAIEASHAGTFGKGFAVVAGEIRRLSEGSSRNSREISGLIKTIGARIRLGVETNERMKEIFTSINAKTSSAVDQIQEIYQAVLEQKTASEEIIRTLALLQSSSEEIKKQADVQSSSGGIIRTNIESLVSSTGNVIEMINGISREINSVLGSITHLKAISTDSLQVISRLKTLMEKEANDPGER